MEPRDKFMFMLLERLETLEDQSFNNTKEIQLLKNKNIYLKNKIIFLENASDPPSSTFHFDIHPGNTSNIKIFDYIDTLKQNIDLILRNIKTCNAIPPSLLEIRIYIFEIPPQGSNILPDRIFNNIHINIILDTNIYIREFNHLINKSFNILNNRIYYSNLIHLPDNINHIWMRGSNCCWLYRVQYPQGKIQSCPVINPVRIQDYNINDRIEFYQ